MLLKLIPIFLLVVILAAETALVDLLFGEKRTAVGPFAWIRYNIIIGGMSNARFWLIAGIITFVEFLLYGLGAIGPWQVLAVAIVGVVAHGYFSVRATIVNFREYRRA